MKKLFCKLIVVTVLISAIMTVSVSAADVDPYNDAGSSLITGNNGKFWSLSLDKHSGSSDKDYGDLIDYTYDGSEISWFPKDGEVDAYNVDIWKAFSITRLGANNKPISINGVEGTEDSIYTTILSYNITPDTEVSSFTIAIAGAQTAYADCAFDGFTLFVDYEGGWSETPDYKNPASSATDKDFTKVAEVSGLITEGKWKNSADGLYRYYEANFDEPFEAGWLTIAWTEKDVEPVLKAVEEGKITKPLMALTEVAVFEDKIPDGSATQAPATDSPAPTEAPETTEAPEATEASDATAAPLASGETDSPKSPAKKGCGSSVTFGTVAVIGICLLAIRKKD